MLPPEEKETTPKHSSRRGGATSERVENEVLFSDGRYSRAVTISTFPLLSVKSSCSLKKKKKITADRKNKENFGKFELST